MLQTTEMMMTKFLARQSCEYSTIITTAESEEEAVKMAENRVLKHWDQAWSPIEIETEDGEEIGDKTEEKTEAVSTDSEPDTLCTVCGSDNVSYAVWFHPNTKAVGDVFGTFNHGDNSFCADCEGRHLLSRGVDDEWFAELLKKYKERSP